MTYGSFVCAVAAKHIDSAPVLFRTWSAAKNPGNNCTIWEAARATSAAPRLFKRIEIGDSQLKQEYVDAGLGCNNPVTHLVKEAAREFGAERSVGCIVSVGTGKPKVAGFSKPAFGLARVFPLELIEVLKKMATSSEVEATAAKERYRNFPGLYHRLNVDKGLEDITLKDWKSLPEVVTHTEKYLHDPDVSREVDEVVEALLGRPSASVTLGHLGI